MSWNQATGVPLEQFSVRFQIFTQKQLKATVRPSCITHTLQKKKQKKKNWHFQM